MLTPDTSGRFISILADGKLHETVSQTTDGAELREYETSDGKKGSKWELVYKTIQAPITNIQFRDGDFGEQIQITFKDESGEVTLSQGVASNFAEDILKKLPNIDLSKPVFMRPYAFTGEDEKMVKGVEIKQDDVKINNFFWDSEKKEPLNGHPKFDGNKDSKDDWKIFFLVARKFLVGYTKENIVPKLKQEPAQGIEYPEEEVNSEQIPFN